MEEGRKLVDLRVVDLKQELEKRKMDISGVKNTLQERLKNVSSITSIYAIYIICSRYYQVDRSSEHLDTHSDTIAIVNRSKIGKTNTDM